MATTTVLLDDDFWFSLLHDMSMGLTRDMRGINADGDLSAGNFSRYARARSTIDIIKC